MIAIIYFIFIDYVDQFETNILCLCLLSFKVITYVDEIFLEGYKFNF